MSKKNAPRAALGIHAGPETLDAVLVRDTEHGPEVVQRFRRQRVLSGETAAAKLAAPVPGFQGPSSSDYTLEVGDGSSDERGAFMPAEFGTIRPPATEQSPTPDMTGSTGLPARSSKPFPAQLRDLLQECRALGHPEPDVSFSIGAPDVSYVELGVPESVGHAESAAGTSPAQRKRLLGLLPQHHLGALQEDRVGFFPLASIGEKRRALALVADPSEPVAQTLTALQAQDTAPVPCVLDAEPSLYAGLLTRSLSPEPGEHTAVVRVGSEDTLVLFFDGTRLRHLERLRSLTSFDAPDTVCSRVLLQQDEKRMGEIHTVLVVSAGRSERLLSAFQGYYPDAAVESVERAFAETGVRFPEDGAAFLKAGAVPALAVALRRLEGWDTGINLLPPRFSRRARRGLPFAWHTALALVLVCMAAAFAFYRYQEKADEIAEVRAFYAQDEVPPPPADPLRLQARVDSLEQTYATYTRALSILDSLLVGSDKWISTMERVSSATAAVPQTWIDTFQPQSQLSADLSGYALSRLSIVDLSRRLSGAIQQITYQDIGERRVYNFQMVIPIANEMPRAALYLRNVAEGEAEPEGETAINPAAHDHN